MRFSLAIIATILPAALGHGQVHRVITPSNVYIAADAYAVADPTSPIRKLSTYGPAADFTGPDITCGPGGNTPTPNLAEIAAGDQITFDWTSWTSVHPGPVRLYVTIFPVFLTLTKCTGGCANFKGDIGSVWVKLDHDGYVPSRANPWAEETLRAETPYQAYTVTIPADLAPGEYLIRHEILGLHVAGQYMGAQFYPNCVQLKVTGNGNLQLPTGIALPGAYDPYDPSILTQLWWITPQNSTYVIPGGPILVSGAPAGYYAISATGGSGPSPSTRPSSSSVKSWSSSARPTSSSTRAISTSIKATTTSPTGLLQTAYGQCGGQGWTGPTAVRAKIPYCFRDLLTDLTVVLISVFPDTTALSEILTIASAFLPK
ncbi:hypothetical protein FRB99_000682 [Tulasnella sp. 403]|nr:hypothetical protein FRB99_000682 [Tulasnella sp. 403]